MRTKPNPTVARTVKTKANVARIQRACMINTPFPFGFSVAVDLKVDGVQIDVQQEFRSKRSTITYALLDLGCFDA